MNIEIITTSTENLQINSILESVKKTGHNAVLNVSKNEDDLAKTVSRKPDLVVLTVKYIITDNQETIWLCDFFAQNYINYSGSSKDTLIFDSDLVLTKSYLKEKGISTPRYFTATPGQYKRDYDIPINYPLFLKTTKELEPVNNFAEFETNVLKLHNLHNTPVLVEEYLDGQEFSVSIIKSKSGDLLVAALEIISVKSEKKLIVIEDKAISNKAKDLAIDIYIELNIRDYGQINIKTNKSGHCFFMHTNLIPDMSLNSSPFLKAFEIDLGLNHDEVIELIVDEGISRVPNSKIQ